MHIIPPPPGTRIPRLASSNQKGKTPRKLKGPFLLQGIFYLYMDSYMVIHWGIGGLKGQTVTGCACLDKASVLFCHASKDRLIPFRAFYQGYVIHPHEFILEPCHHKDLHFCSLWRGMNLAANSSPIPGVPVNRGHKDRAFVNVLPVLIKPLHIKAVCFKGLPPHLVLVKGGGS